MGAAGYAAGGNSPLLGGNGKRVAFGRRCARKRKTIPKVMAFVCAGRPTFETEDGPLVDDVLGPAHARDSGRT